MRRREFIILMGSASVALSLAAHAEHMPRIGVLMGVSEDDPESESWIKAFFEGLSQFGWVRDENLRVNIRWAGVDLARMQQLAKELIELRPEVIQVTTTPATAALLRETHTIPVVFAVVSDPLGSAFIESFARPGGNATGFVNFED
jgi:putative ABC transport system substrate-binding protein